MSDLVIAAASLVTPADVSRFQFGMRFGRLDPVCQLGLTAVEALGVDFTKQPRAEIGVCLETKTGSLFTDVQYWRSRNEPGGASPSLFVYTLPSSLIGEIAIRYGLTGPDLCLMGGPDELLPEASDWLRRGEAQACVVVYCDVLTAPAAGAVELPATARAGAVFLQRGGAGPLPHG